MSTNTENEFEALLLNRSARIFREPKFFILSIKYTILNNESHALAKNKYSIQSSFFDDAKQKYLKYFYSIKNLKITKGEVYDNRQEKYFKQDFL